MLVAGLDLETTGVDFEKGDRITEIAFDIISTKTQKRKHYVRRVNPERNVSARAQQITGLSWDMLKGEPVWKEVSSDVDKLLSKIDVLVAHNGESFDFPFLFHEQAREGYPPPTKIQLVDTMTGARSATPDGKLPSLEELAWCFGFDYNTQEAHSALYDARLALECYLKGKDKGLYL
jgi:DNA polymerase-3 subunit epsilon